jgi:hypothetical protein
MADKYVRKGASGTGSGADWTNAYTDFGSVSLSGMTSGNTLWIAAGSYTGGLPNITVAGLIIKRATIAAHGTSTGWSNGYDGQVVVTGADRWATIVANAVTIDGVTRNPWGIRLVGIAHEGVIHMGNSAQWINCDGFTLRNVEMDGNSLSDPAIYGMEDGLRSNTISVTNLLVEYCYIHDFRQLSDEHTDGVQIPEANGLTFRYNYFRNNGMMLYLGDNDWGSCTARNVLIHHNVFWCTTDCINDQNYWGINTNGMASLWTVDNNTFAIRTQVMHDYNYPECWGRDAIRTNKSQFTAANFRCRNNIFYSSDPAHAANGTHNNNCYFFLPGDDAPPWSPTNPNPWAEAPAETGRVITDPLFVSVAGYDFRLQDGSPCKTTGANLGYTQDILGNIVGSTNISMGAYQYGSTSVPTGTLVLSITP